jgi:single-strand DNA-binding protein
MVGLNRVMLIGNLGTEPEMRYAPSGSPVTSFRLAVNSRFATGEGERSEETEWFNVVTWNRTAENCNQMLSKGQSAYVEGRLRTRSWEGQDGQRRYRTEVIADRVVFLSRRDASPAQEGEPQEAEGPPL